MASNNVCKGANQPATAEETAQQTALRRKKLVNKIADTLRAFVFSDTFCYSFPKPDDVEESYHNAVTCVKALVKRAQEEDSTLVVKHPTEQSLNDATGVVETTRKKFRPPYNVGVLRPEYGGMEIRFSDEQMNAIQAEVDSILPHFTLLTVGGLSQSVNSHSAGQFLVNINPALHMMRLNFFEYTPKYSKAAKEAIKLKKPSKKMWIEVMNNMCLFEMSRQFALQIPLKNIRSAKLLADSQDGTMGVLIINVEKQDVEENENGIEVEIENENSFMFLQRHVSTNKDQLNAWKTRSNFLAFDEMRDYQRTNFTFHLGGPIEELSDVLAFLHVTEPKLKVQASDADQNDITDAAEQEKPEDASKADVDPVDDMEKDVKKRRKSILKLLLKYKIIEEEEYNQLLQKPKKIVRRARTKVNNYLGGIPGFDDCFKDYINFKCEDVRQLAIQLSSPLNASEYGYEIEAFRFRESALEDLTVKGTLDLEDASDSGEEEAPEGNGITIDNMRIGDFIALQKEYEDTDNYFSFCYEYIANTDHDTHCTEDFQCSDWHHWHCFDCNQCTYGQSIPECEHCGSDGNGEPRGPIVPFSLEEHYIDQEDEDTMWRVNLLDTDIIDWSGDSRKKPGTKKPADKGQGNTDAATNKQNNLDEEQAGEKGAEQQGMEVGPETGHTFRLEEVLSDQLGLMSQPSSVLGPAGRRKTSKAKARKPRQPLPSMEQLHGQQGECNMQ